MSGQAPDLVNRYVKRRCDTCFHWQRQDAGDGPARGECRAVCPPRAVTAEYITPADYWCGEWHARPASQVMEPCHHCGTLTRMIVDMRAALGLPPVPPKGANPVRECEQFREAFLAQEAELERLRGETKVV